MIRTLILALTATLVAASPAQQTVDPVEVRLQVVVDGEKVKFEGQGPVVINQRVYVPLRGVFERIGATVDYDKELKAVTASTDSRSITLPVQGNRAEVDGRALVLSEHPIVMNDRLLVPLRLLSEALGADVEWKASKMTVTITRKSAVRLLESSGTCYGRVLRMKG